MIQKVYSLFDKKVEAFGTPFFMPNDEAAIRAVKDAASNKNTTLNRHPEDFELVGIGSWDDATGIFDEYEQDFPAKMICQVNSLVPSQAVEPGLFEESEAAE